MYFPYFFLELCLVGITYGFGYYPNPSGPGQKLIGSSFGVIGKNATYDFVVSFSIL